MVCSKSSFAANLVLDSRTQRPKGFGFVSYESESQAEKAMKAMNGRVILSSITTEFIDLIT